MAGSQSLAQSSPEERIKQKRSMIQNLFDLMSPAARAQYESLMARLNSRSSEGELVAEVHASAYLRTPVEVQTFIEDPYYLGRILRGNIYPQIMDDLIELFGGSYSEVLLGGGIGWGKSAMADIGIAYDIYQLSCLKSPADSFGLLPGSNVAFINVSVNKTQARKILFGGLVNLIKNSPYFSEHFRYDRNVLSELRFPRGVFAYPVAAMEQSLLGEGVYGAAFDEMNFYSIVEKSKQHPEGGTYDQAMQLYNRMSRRLTSRMNQRGRLPGHLWLISSARYPNDFTERKEVEALTDRKIFVRRYAAWETRPKKFYMTQTFKVEVGDVTKRTRVLDGSETDVSQDRVIEVPYDFKEAFDKDPDGAARDFGGRSVLSIRPFIGRRDLITKMMKSGLDRGRQHPFTNFTVTLQNEWEQLLPEHLHWVPDAKSDKMVLSTGPYYAHIDLALSGDAAGIGICHVVGSKKVTRGFGAEQKVETKPLIRVDLVLQVVHPPNGEIRLSAARELLYRLRDMGMQFGKVTYDSWGSAESIQQLKSEGFVADEFSVDVDGKAYEACKEAIYDERLDCYPMPVLEMELATVRRDEKTGKIDHPPLGSKDCSDSLAGAVWHCEEAFATGATNQWQGVQTVQPYKAPFYRDENAELWDKVRRGLPLTEAEIAKL